MFLISKMYCSMHDLDKTTWQPWIAFQSYMPLVPDVLGEGKKRGWYPLFVNAFIIWIMQLWCRTYIWFILGINALVISHWLLVNGNYNPPRSYSDELSAQLPLERGGRALCGVKHGLLFVCLSRIGRTHYIPEPLVNNGIMSDIP